MALIKKLIAAIFLITVGIACTVEQNTDWYESETINKPFLRWWWMGSAVDLEGLTYNLEEFAKAGIGGVEITPIYGVQGNEDNDIPYLSDKWMDIYRFTVGKAEELGMQVDMSGGTGWPFGGPEITPELAAKMLVIENGEAKMVPTEQMVKRAAPGGVGYVLDHYKPEAVKAHLDRFDKRFGETGAPHPATWFNDSFEVYDAGWTDAFPDVFKERYGYDICEKLLHYGDEEEHSRALCDYRECLGTMLLENFTIPWTEWAHSHGALTRNQAHGSPANLIDLYAAVDIPETETFGRSDIFIPGLRQDSLTKHNYGDPAVIKLASSAAHLKGKKYTSSETLTWLSEHFRTSLSQCKPEIDQAFCAGVNHMMLHGAPYSPAHSEFPGWVFYATVNMSPTGGMWTDAPALFKYIERCQAFLTAGEPDSDFLVYFPIHDGWSIVDDEMFMMIGLKEVETYFNSTKKVIYDIRAAGFDADYISDKLLLETEITKPVLVPACKYMPEKTAQRLADLKKSGVKIIFLDSLPSDVPGLKDLEARRIIFNSAKENFDAPASLSEALEDYRCETFARDFGGSYIRRRNEAGGHNYFMSMLADRRVDQWVKLAVPAASAEIFDPLDGRKGKALIRKAEDGCCEVYLQMNPGQSLLLKTFPADIKLEPWKYLRGYGEKIVLDKGWSISFVKSEPEIDGVFQTDTLIPWNELDIPEATINRGTARYTTAFTVNDADAADGWMLDLGDVRESAKVHINGEYVATLFSVPFRTDIGKWLHDGENLIEIDVTNLDANRIADMERRQVRWRIFKDVNVCSIGKDDYCSFGVWDVFPSGLNSEVSITPVTY